MASALTVASERPVKTLGSGKVFCGNLKRSEKLERGGGGGGGKGGGGERERKRDGARVRALAFLGTNRGGNDGG